MHKKNLFRLIFTIFISVQAVGCGGGGDDSSSSNPTPKSLYTGNANPAILDESNSIRFVEILFGNALNSTPLTKSRPVIVDNNSIMLNQSVVISNISEIIINHAAPSLLQARAILTTEHCFHGGTMHKEGTLDDDDDTGTVRLTYTDCEAVEGIVLSGRATVSTFSTNYPKSEKITLNELSVQQEQTNLVMTGTIEGLVDFDDERDKYRRFETRNILSVNTDTNISSLLENVEIEINGSAFENTETGSISGKIYLENEGYVSLTASDDFIPYFDGRDLYPQNGTTYLTGASNSKARLTHIVEPSFGSYPADIGTDSEYRLDLDKNGDGVFELTSIQFYENTQPESNFEENQKPIAAIHLNYLPGTYDDCRAVDDDRVRTHYSRNTLIYMLSECSTDLENDELTFQWTLESKPTGSSAELNESDNALINSIETDLRGVYKVSLKATDLDGSSLSDTSFIDITVPNYIPYIYFDDSFSGYIGLLNKPLYIGVISTDDSLLSEDPEFEYITTSYEWVSKPAGSTAELKLVTNEYVTSDSSVQTARRDEYEIIAEKTGSYTVKFHATDVEGKTFSTDYGFKIVE